MLEAMGARSPTPSSTCSSHPAVSSSSMSLAYMSSEARIFFAFTNICFSPVESPFSCSRSERFRTTSASSKMSPVFILSRLYLNRRFQFFGMVVPALFSTSRTRSTISSSITLRRPTRSAFSVGTLTTMSLWRIWMVKYSRSWLRAVRISFRTTVPAPWWGYTTLSPTSNTPSPPSCLSGGREGGGRRRGRPRRPSQLEVPVDQVVLLQAPEALADLPGPDRADAVDGLEVPVARPQDRLEGAEVPYDVGAEASGKPGRAGENPGA